MKPAFLYFFAFAFLFAGQTAFAQWQPTNGPYGGGYALLQNDTYVFASSTNGIHRTTDGGLNWEKVPIGPTQYQVQNLIAVVGPNLLAVTSAYSYQSIPHILVSHNNGDSWAEVPLPNPATQLSYFAFDGQTITAQGSTNTNYATFHTSDEGLNWNMLTLPNGSNSFLPWTGASGDLLATNEDGLFVSQDNGTTWNNIPIPNTQPGHIDQIQVIDSSILIIPNYSVAQYTYISHDYGITWNIMYLGPHSVSKIIKYNGAWYCTWDGYLRKLEPGDLSWQLIEDPAQNLKNIGGLAIQNGVFLTTLNVSYVGRDIQRSTDGGITFNSAGDGMVASQVFALFPRNGKLFASSQRGIQKVNTSTWDWDNAAYVLDSTITPTGIWADENKILAIANGRLLLSINQGQSWANITPIPFANNTSFAWYPIECKGDTIFFDRFRSTDLGSTWINIAETIVPTSNNASGIVYKDSSMFIYKVYGGVYRSDDGGNTWVQKNVGLPAPGWDGYLGGGPIYKAGDILFVPAYGPNYSGGLFRSLDNGESWELAGSGLDGCRSCQFIWENRTFLDIGNYLMVNWGGQLHISPDDGLHWIPYPTIDRTYCIATDGNQLFAGTDGLGLYAAPIPSNFSYHIFKGKVYKDNNDNGIREPNEPWLPYHNVTLKETPQSTSTDSLGYFEFYTQAIADTATVSFPNPSVSTNPPFHVFSEIDSIYEFGVRPSRYAEGHVYNDANNNGIRDAGEQGLQGVSIAVDNGYEVSTTDVDGYYLLSLSPDFDTIRAVSPNPFGIVYPAYRLLSYQDSIYDFGIFLPPNFPDLSLSLNASNVPGPGFTEIYYLTVKNLGAETSGANLVFNFDPSLVYQSADYAPITVNGNQIQWQLPSLQPLETFQISVHLQVPTTAPLNSILNHNAAIEPQNATDIFPQNNVDSLTEIVLGSFDPNDKQVRPQGDFSSLQIAASERLNYKIRFQNTGNFPAEKVVLLDTLAAGLDPATMRIEAASHAYEWNIIDNHIVEFIFDMINLPDSTSNEAESHGFVEYSILCKDSMRLGGIINNTAHIYFDFNAPITTNTTHTPVIRSSQVQTQTARVCVGELLNGQLIHADTVFTAIVSYPYFDSIYLTVVEALPVYNIAVDTAVQIGMIFLGLPIGQDTTIILNQFTADGCDSTTTYHLSVLTSLNSHEKDKYALKVFPTIITDLINIQSPKVLTATMEASLFSPLGSKIGTWQLKSGASRWQLDSSDLLPGLYFLSIKIGGESLTFKLVKY